ncbi:stage 0 sporulation family protein [Chloroflexota bacterium]
MAEVVGVRFRRAGKIYYFDPAGIELEANDQAVVETSRGPELGQVAIAPKQVLANELKESLKPVLRKATDADIKHAAELTAREEEALTECYQLITEYNLPMKLLAAEYNLDASHLSFLFSAEERVDFRKLVRELNNRFKTRVELRQVGPRDEAKLCGGFGRCGRQLCCASFLTEFAPISIRMAKEQDLPLNPMKISGICGRLLCCLSYETGQYRAMKSKLPKVGQRVNTSTGVAKVVGVNVLKDTVMVQVESGVSVELPRSEITVGDKKPPLDKKDAPKTAK